MHTKLAGHLSLQDMISAHISSAEEKLASAAPQSTREEVVEEQEASGLNPSNPDEVEKLAQALEYIGDMVKEADSIELGGEKSQGGMVLPTQSPTTGRQSYNFGKARHTVPVSQATMGTVDNPGAKNAIPTDDKRAPGGNGARYPAKGVFKTAAEGVMAKIEAVKKKHEKGESEEKEEKEEKAVKGDKEKASSVDFILNKIAESPQGGLTLDSKSGEGPKPETGGSNSARSHIESNSAVVNMKKVDGKNPQKKQLSEVLKEPAQKSGTDPVVKENLRNASKGGVKIAAARAFLAKIAEGGCTCGDQGGCKFCKLQEAVSKKDEGKESNNLGQNAGGSATMQPGANMPVAGL